MRRTIRATAWPVALAVTVPLALVACTGDQPQPRSMAGSAGRTPAPRASASPTQPLALAITPAAGARKLPISTELGTRVTGGRVANVTVSDDKGGRVAGEMRDDGSAWVPAKPLRYGRTYTASVTATAADGRTETRTTTFSTMKSKPGREIGTGLYLFDGNTYGVAMPVVVEFNPGIPARDRAGVQKRLFVRSVPAQPGAWHWVENGTQAYYRPPVYWQPGTKLTVRMALAGHPVGKGRYGPVDRRATVTIGRKLTMEIRNKNKRMYVYKNDKLIKKMAVSLGKRSTPSSSGTLVIMDKQVSTVFDTFAELGPGEGYRTTIAYAQRLTWGGEFIHSAPWSVGDQGRRNVSHGCVNVAPGNAVWLFDQTLIGDPVTVRGTERKIDSGNGWTAWTHSWAEFIKGSALPVAPDLAAAGGTTRDERSPVAETGPTSAPRTDAPPTSASPRLSTGAASAAP